MFLQKLPNFIVDDFVLRRFAEVVKQMRGTLSQRDFANLMGVSQSAIYSWENQKNLPNLDSLERLARMRGQLPEEFIAYLYGRDLGRSLPIEEQVNGMSDQEIRHFLLLIIDKKIPQSTDQG